MMGDWLGRWIYGWMDGRMDGEGDLWASGPLVLSEGTAWLGLGEG